MGGMGRQFDGGYTEYTCVPATQVQLIETKLDWATLDAIPEINSHGVVIQSARSRVVAATKAPWFFATATAANPTDVVPLRIRKRSPFCVSRTGKGCCAQLAYTKSFPPRIRIFEKDNDGKLRIACYSFSPTRDSNCRADSC